MAQCPHSWFEYTVRGGDTHAALARRFGIPEEALRAQAGALTPGRTVKLSCPAGACRKGAFYALRRGDTLRRVAERAGVTLNACLKPTHTSIRATTSRGQAIVIPAGRTSRDVYSPAR